MQTILLIYPLQIFGDAIARALQPHYLITVVPDFASARDRLEKDQLILLSIANQQDAEGFYFLRELVDNGYKVIALLGEKNPHLLRACVLLGAYGMVESDGSIVELKMKMDTVASGQRAYANHLLSDAMHYYYEHFPVFSEKSLAIVDALFKLPQPSNQQIGKTLDMSDGRVRNILTPIFVALAIKGRSKLPQALLDKGYFVGFTLAFPKGFTKSSDSVLVVNGSTKYALTLP